MNRRIGPFNTITVFGGASIDRLATSAGPPALGVSNPGSARTLPGGVGLNIATTLARLEHAVRLVACVGADSDGETVIAAARAAGINTSGVGVSSTRPTASYHGAFDHQGGLIIGISDMAIYEDMLPAAVAAAVEQASGDEFWLVDTNLPAETLDFLVGEAAAAGRPIAALTVSPVKATRLKPLLDRLAVLFTNRREAAALLDRPWDERRPSTIELGAELSRERAPVVVITNSGDPLVLASGGEVRSLAPLRASVKSVNGAGDALAAGTIHGLALGRTLSEAVLSGMATAALTLESDGTVSPTMSARAIVERIASAGSAN